MGDDAADAAIRQAMGRSSTAAAWLLARAGTTDDPHVAVMAALLADRVDYLDRAEALATSARDRQIVSIALARLVGDVDRVDVLARDHLVDHPDSVIVAWIAATELPDCGLSRSPCLREGPPA